MAIMTQVYVARARYKYLTRSAETAADYYKVQRRLKAQVEASVAANIGSEQTMIREEMNTLVAAIQYDVAYADLQNAFAAIYASVGSDPFDGNISTAMSVSELSKVLKTTWRSRGDKHL
jgi:phage gp29-like protein